MLDLEPVTQLKIVERDDFHQVFVIAALEKELEHLLNKAKSVKSINTVFGLIRKCELNEKVVYTLCTGAGKIKAAASVQFIISNFWPSAILMTGACGSLNKDLKKGFVVVADNYVQHDVDCTGAGLRRGVMFDSKVLYVVSSDLLLNLVESFGAYTSRFASGDSFVTSKESAFLIKKEFCAEVVDMESAAAAIVCEVNRVPFIAIKAVSDMAGLEESPGKSTKEDFDNNISLASKNAFEFLELVLPEVQKRISYLN